MNNNADKRTVTTDALETLGMIIDDTAMRDAIHLAVEPVISAEELRPGEDVGFLEDGRAGRFCKDKVGIVDPFLKSNVKKGERFWLVVYPRQITSLRHVWTHPAFDNSSVGSGGITKANPSDPVENSKAWIDGYATKIGVFYNQLMEHAESFIHNDDNYWSRPEFEGECIPDEFWDHYEIVTGAKVENNRYNFLTCSC